LLQALDLRLDEAPERGWRTRVIVTGFVQGVAVRDCIGCGRAACIAA
jgi:hypothetical protein